jgi:hypothetical protein
MQSKSTERVLPTGETPGGYRRASDDRKISEMKFVMLSQRRSGGTFVRDLAYKVLSAKPSEMQGRHYYAMPARNDSLSKAWRSKELGNFIHENHVRCIKIEEPGRDNLARWLRKTYPHLPFLISRRNIDEIIYSHWNIRSWGEKNIQHIIDDWKRNLFVYEHMFKHFESSPMVVIDVNRPQQITPQQFARFFDVAPSDNFIEAFGRWSPVNTLERKWEEDTGDLECPAVLEQLVSVYPEIPEIERRYDDLIAKCLSRI